jgi:hypothetical protein
VGKGRGGAQQRIGRLVYDCGGAGHRLVELARVMQSYRDRSSAAQPRASRHEQMNDVAFPSGQAARLGRGEGGQQRLRPALKSPHRPDLVTGQRAVVADDRAPQSLPSAGVQLGSDGRLGPTLRLQSVHGRDKSRIRPVQHLGTRHLIERPRIAIRETVGAAPLCIAVLVASHTHSIPINMHIPWLGSDGERLQHLRSVLPCGVRVTASTHPLFGELLEASGFKWWDGVLLLVVALLDGSAGTIRADATDVFAGDRVEPTCFVLDGVGLQGLRVLVAGLQRRPRALGGGK